MVQTFWRTLYNNASEISSPIVNKQHNKFGAIRRRQHIKQRMRIYGLLKNYKKKSIVTNRIPMSTPLTLVRLPPRRWRRPRFIFTKLSIKIISRREVFWNRLTLTPYPLNIVNT